MRMEYEKASLDFDDLLKDPCDLFKKWWQEAIDKKDPMLDAVYLSTVKIDQPDGRIVLLKSLDDGFTFFTNYQSAKALELEENPKACMVFYWPSLERQVRIKGQTQKTSPEVSKDYFQTRPHGSQISAWASPQSQVVKDRQVLHDQVLHFEQKYLKDVPCPPHWGGYRLQPHYFEYWQGRTDRLHDRFCYKLTNHAWSIERLAP